MSLAADELELGWLNAPALPEADAGGDAAAKLEQYRKTIDRYELEPETREGKKELIVRAREHEEKRDHALKQDPYFDYAEALLQIAIVLISVAIVADLAWLAFLGGAIGIFGYAADDQRFLSAGGDTGAGVRTGWSCQGELMRTIAVILIGLFTATAGLASEQLSAARDKAIRECNEAANKYSHRI